MPTTRIVMRPSAMDGRDIYWPEVFCWPVALFFPIVFAIPVYWITTTATHPIQTGVWVSFVIVELLLTTIGYYKLGWVAIPTPDRFYCYRRSEAEWVVDNYLKE